MTLKKRSYNEQNRNLVDEPHTHFKLKQPDRKADKYIKNALRSKNTHSLLATTEYKADIADEQWNSNA